MPAVSLKRISEDSVIEHLNELATGGPLQLDVRLVGENGKTRAAKSFTSARETESRKREEEQVRDESVRQKERIRIAQELHDTLLQTFQSASLYLGAALHRVPEDFPVRSQLDRTLEIMRQGITEGRQAIQGLRSPNARSLDLLLRLSRIHHELDVEPGVDFRIAVAGQLKQLAPEIEDEIYRIGREALTNAFRHSGAKRVELTLQFSDTRLTMRVHDDGHGIDSRVLEKGCDGHWGLEGMRERATRIGGLLRISSSPSVGTEIQLSVSLTHDWIHFQNIPSNEKTVVAVDGVLESTRAIRCTPTMTARSNP